MLKVRSAIFTLILFTLHSAKAEESINEKQIERFATAITQINHYYIDKVSYTNLFDNAIRGMLTSLDPHSDYLSPKDIKDLQLSTTGEYAGIGIEIIPENGLIKVISPLDDTPAAKAGIQPGDIIIQINQQLVKDISTEEAIKMIQGKVGTTVNLTVLRESNSDTLSFDITREVIQVKSVRSDFYRDKTAYIKIAAFGDNTTAELKEQLTHLMQTNHTTGLIIDLRNNPGGTLNSAIETSDLFLDKGKLQYNNLIVYTKGRLDIDNMEAYATSGDITNGLPIVVLINNGSASAAEILAGALKDQKRAIVLGTQSFGKGSVQTVIPIDYESAIKLTTALYYTPSGNSIQATGIIPDVYAPYTAIPNSNKKIGFDTLNNLQEKHLSNHIASTNTNDSALHTKSQQALLAHKDFQLYQALNLIDGMSARH